MRANFRPMTPRRTFLYTILSFLGFTGCKEKPSAQANASTPTAAPPAPESTAKPSVADRVKKVVAEVLKIQPETIKPSQRFAEDLGTKYIDEVEIVVSLEEEFGVTLEKPATDRMLTVDDVIKYFESLKK